MASKCFVFIFLFTFLLILTCLATLTLCEPKEMVSINENKAKKSESERRVTGEQTAIKSGTEKLAEHRTKRSRRNRKWRKKNRKRKPTTTPKPTNRTILEDINWSKEDCYINEEYESGYDLTGYCFLNSPYTLFQNNAEEFCQKFMGYRLVTINSKRKQWAVASYVKAHKHEWGYYISAIDVDPNGDQYWRSTGQTVRYTKWALGGMKSHERNETGPQPCLAINANNRLWYRLSCTYLGRALCEKVVRTKATPKPTTTTVAPRIRKIYPEIQWKEDDCRSTIKRLWYFSVYYPVGHCFIGSRRWGHLKYMEEYCDKQKGYRLVTINSPEKQKAVAAYVRDHRTNLNYYISSIDQDDKGELYWRSTGQTVRYNNWASKKPKTSAQPCVLINRFSFEWMSQDCSTAGPALCEKVFRVKEGRPTPRPTTRKPSRKIYQDRKWSQDDCKLDYSDYLPDGNCIMKKNDLKSHRWAKSWCTELNYQPITVNSQDKQNVLERYIKNNPHQKSYWMSDIDRDDNGQLYWLSTGQTVRFTNFADDVVDKTGPHHCLIMDSQTQKWHDVQCLYRGAVLCEKVEEGSIQG